MTAASKIRTPISFEGKPVPWVVRWTGEASETPLQVAFEEDRLRLHYADGHENRDGDTDVLWQREGIQRSGVPEFAQLSTYRQRAAMLNRRCQVCGDTIEGPITWLLGGTADLPQLQYTSDGDPTTMSPPTCEPCVEYSREVCPHLVEVGGGTRHKVLAYEPWAFYGNPVVAYEDGIQMLPEAMLTFEQIMSNPLLTILAKQLVVRFTKFSLL